MVLFPMSSRDYSLTGPQGARAVAAGLVTQNWYRTPVSRADIKALSRRADQPALRDTIWLFALMVGFAAAASALWPSWWSLPFWLAYGVLYGSAMDSRWHECGHGTAFKTGWMNRLVYQIACFCMIRDPHCWKFSHARHHSDTIIVGRDPEIAIMRPTNIVRLIANLIGIVDCWDGMKKTFIHAGGKITADEASYVPESSYGAIFRTARIWLLIYVVTIACALVFQSVLPLLLIGLPRLYGCWHMVLCGWLQHGGLADNVIDHRLNSRTVYMNPVSRFIYWNMNYHVEHHMFPMVPYYRLPQLHRLVAHDLPAPSPSLWAGLSEMLPALVRQRDDPDFHIRRPLPVTANDYLEPSSVGVDS